MIGRPYIVSTGDLTDGDAQDYLRITAPSDSILIIDKVRFQVSGSSAPDYLEAIFHRPSTDGTGTAKTPQPLRTGDPAAGTTAISPTSDPTLGTIIFNEVFNFLGTLIWHPTPVQRIIIPPSGRFSIRMNNAAVATMNIAANIHFREVGG